MPGIFTFLMEPAEIDGRLFFVADAGANGYELWATDGSASGTQLVLLPGSTGTNPLSGFNDFVISGSSLFFDANYDGTGENLYRVIPGGMGLAEAGFGNLLLYPNPASGSVFLSLPEKVQTYDLEVFNMRGERVLFHRQLIGQRRELPALPAGLYLLRVSYDRISTTLRLIKY